ncbi:putative F-box protein PP2-B12 isoform X2 [Salvia miltiorrhiza]|uniref:putative F-box protein PP2-B12 isoform X2 n=1 Tax=Salvia miltiorrhiza TaxID=226208 RepID=UPI0025AD6CAF|nr:putative F-box protein PP2-B12 isoform X2 [Salvia miltiorrhiza]
MGKNYDNWERLVKAVSRREEDKLLALTHSVSASSSSSSQLSFSSTSQFAPDACKLPMEYSDLTVDRKDWKAMLPPGEREVVWRSLSMSFFLDGRTGKNCFLLGAMSLIFGLRGFDDFWKFNPHPQSRFSYSAELVDSQCFYIQGNVKTKMLSSETCYAAYLVFGFAETYAKLYSAVSIIRNFYDEPGGGYPEEQAKMVKFQEGNDREDGWMEIQVGEFYVDLEENGEVQVQLLDTSGNTKSGLIVEGIELRPFNSI